MEDSLSTSTGLSTTNIDSQTEQLAQKILESDNVDEIKDLTAMFNLNFQKRNVIRTLKMGELLDDITDEITARVKTRPEMFNNETLLKYMQATETAMDNAVKKVSGVEDFPAIQLQQNNQINIGTDVILDRDSRQRVSDTVQQILKDMKNGSTPIPTNSFDVDGEED